MEPFKVSYRGLPPYVYHLPTGSVGLDIDLVRILAQKLKMNLEMFEFDSWIDIDPQTGALGGSVGLVMNGTYDMVVGNLPFPVGVIKKSTNLTTFIYDLDIKMTTAKPRPLTPLLNVIRPFSPTIWMTSFGTIIFCGMVFALKSRSHKIRSQVILWWMLGVLLSQSRSSKGLRRAKVHLIMVVWMFFTFCLKHFYECNFRANLIAVDYEPTIDSIPDLVKLGRRLYIPSGTQFQDMLDGYPDPNFKFLGQMARQEGLMFNYDEQGLVEYEAEQIILKNGDGFLLNEYMGLATFGNLEDRYDGHNPYRISKNVIFPSMGYFLTRANFPHLMDLDCLILSLYESGIPNHLRKSYISPKYLVPSQDQVVHMEPFHLEQVFAPFFMLSTGLIVSSIVFAWQRYTLELE
ncbi:uncharacterized protein LOC131888963 [Tigriopus californicus]|uniref:uncharacterized protein LOC131888963 n=1 Tax=Tigriopus californicus TaxID=6832 RepID=UPI0027DA02B8|nr:uncharacterized protein LOC131888963 [Tigriopus californicus]